MGGGERKGEVEEEEGGNKRGRKGECEEEGEG